MTTVEELQQLLLQNLDYAGNTNLRKVSTDFWQTGREIAHIEFAYLVNGLPLVYFSQLTEVDEDAIQLLHKRVWSQSRTPLLFVTLPHEIRVYSGYSAPSPTQQALIHQLIGLNSVLEAQNIIRSQLLNENNSYSRFYLETGAFWGSAEGKKFNTVRADQKFITNMKVMREELLIEGLSNQEAYALLGRSILIRYLEDRGYLTPSRLSNWMGIQLDSYEEILSSKQQTYQLFEKLADTFNGDLFPVTDSEKEIVTQEHLHLVQRWLTAEDLATGQQSFFSFDFSFIPIELVSNVYDVFIGAETQKSTGAYYTPLPLVDFILEESLPIEKITHDFLVLDPACGSGIFLVGTYRRLIAAWKISNPGTEITPDTLVDLVRKNIFGVDLNENAVRIAAFSLYLEILNHITNELLEDAAFKFPILLGHNLIAQDFFDQSIYQYFKNVQFDRIVGNLPWGKGTLSDKAEKWANKNKWAVSGKQAAPAFLGYIPEFLGKTGEVAVIAPVKHTVLLTNSIGQEFREKFLLTYSISAVVNFSAVRKEKLFFEERKSPCALFIYNNKLPEKHHRFVYASVKPTYWTHLHHRVVIELRQLHSLVQFSVRKTPHIWKYLTWGNHRDGRLIDRLEEFHSLNTYIEKRNWRFGVGFIESKTLSKREAKWLSELPLVITKSFEKYALSRFGEIQTTQFHAPRVEKTYQAPMVLVHRSTLGAAYSEKSVAYKDLISCINMNDEKSAKWITCYINSPVVKYYQFLTSTRWGIERDPINHNELGRTPIYIPEVDSNEFNSVISLFDKIRSLLQANQGLQIDNLEAKISKIEQQIAQIIFDGMQLSPIDQQQILDTLEYGVGFFNWSQKISRSKTNKVVSKPDNMMLEKYADAFSDSVNTLLKYRDKTINATMYSNGSPLTIAGFEIVDINKQSPIQVESTSNALKKQLEMLDKQALQQKSPSVFVQRYVNLYSENQIALIRPSEQRFWTESQARADADKFIAESVASSLE